MGREVLVAGSLNVDYNLAVEKEPADDGTARVTGFSVTGGGHGGNCAIALAGLGCRVSLFSAVGDDPEGVALRDELERCGVLHEKVVDVAGSVTGRVFIPTYPDHSGMLMFRGATDQWSSETCASMPLSDFEAVVLSDPPPAVTQELVARAVAVGVPVHWTPGGLHASSSWALELAAQCHQVFVNQTEFAEMFEVSADPDHIREACRRHRIPRLVVTLGDRGAMASDGTNVWFTEAPTVTVADATGAGDAFTAGFVAAELLGCAWPLPLAWGAAAGSHAVTVSGARDTALSLKWLQATAAALCTGVSVTEREKRMMP
ncbi:PfkB family carbohydrate kinase [Streptomyces sp. GbtcB6]|uniref:carbohydrate kinase family protein n=1 Tax=Streptomyces sp. GbtcB6 TaxID=2824751 RepID=UPI001C3022B4|nr:PfkB family carbohydrate kinase [Streptomyces sp. GbtcB6]